MRGASLKFIKALIPPGAWRNLTALIALVTFQHGSALGADQHYRDIIVGEQASGLGGAYIAISDDPSGIYYNPAGIVFGMENYFSLSANAYEKSTRIYKNALGGQDYTYTSSGLVPTFFGLTQSVGKGKWGFAVVVPSQENYDQDDVLTNISTDAAGAKTMKRRYLNQDWTYMIGPAYAREISKDFTLGISVLGVYRSRKTIDNQLILFNNGRYVLDAKTIDQTSYGVYTKIGTQYMPLPKVSLGATVAKNFTVKSDRKIHLIDVDTINTTNPVETDSVSSPKLPSPIEMGVGVSYFPTKKSLYAADFLYYTADSAYTDYALQATWNVSLATEQYISETSVLRVGLYTNNANTPKVSSNATNQADHVDLYGVTAAYALRGAGSSITFGTTYSMGKGEGQVIGDTKTVNEIQESRLAIYLIGSYQL